MPSKSCCKKTQYLAREACALINDQVVTVSYIEHPTAYSISGFRRVDTMELLAAEPRWVDCCTEVDVQTYSQCFVGFDYQEFSVWETGDDSILWEINVGGSITNSVDNVIVQDNGNKSSWYTNLQAAVNATAWDMSLQTDVLSSTNGGKPTWLFTGPVGSTLILARQSGGDDVLTMTVNADGTVTTTFESANGDTICSSCLDC